MLLRVLCAVCVTCCAPGCVGCLQGLEERTAMMLREAQADADTQAACHAQEVGALQDVTTAVRRDQHTAAVTAARLEDEIAAMRAKLAQAHADAQAEAAVAAIRMEEVQAQHAVALAAVQLRLRTAKAAVVRRFPLAGSVVPTATATPVASLGGHVDTGGHVGNEDVHRTVGALGLGVDTGRKVGECAARVGLGAGVMR